MRPAEERQILAPEAAAAFVDGHYRDVYRFFLWTTNDAEAAADLTQETFAAFWRTTTLDPGEREIPDLKGWLFGIARNLWRKRCRDARPAGPALEELADLPDTAPGPEAALLAGLDVEEVAGAVASLPPEYRECLVLRVFQEWDYQQIAAALDITAALARWRVHRARVWLRAALTTK